MPVALEEAFTVKGGGTLPTPWLASHVCARADSFPLAEILGHLDQLRAIGRAEDDGALDAAVEGHVAGTLARRQVIVEV